MNRLEHFIQALWPSWYLRRQARAQLRRMTQEPREKMIPEHQDISGERWLPRPEKQDTERT